MFDKIELHLAKMNKMNAEQGLEKADAILAKIAKIDMEHASDAEKVDVAEMCAEIQAGKATLIEYIQAADEVINRPRNMASTN